MPEPEKTYVNLILDERETSLLIEGKEKSGIKGNADFIRHLITAYATGEKNG